jgi:hypothetical protein
MRVPGVLRWLAVAILATSSLTSVAACGDDSSADSASDSDVISAIGEGAARWISGLVAPAATTLSCPGIARNARIIASNTTARGCLWSDSRGSWFLKVQNLSRVPITINFARSWANIEPGATDDYPISNPQYGNYITYQPDLRAATSQAVLNYVKGKLNPVYEWRECAGSLTVGCLLAAFEKLLPSQIKLGSKSIPAKRLVGLMKTIWEYAPLVTAYTQRAVGVTSGQLSLATD